MWVLCKDNFGTFIPARFEALFPEYVTQGGDRHFPDEIGPPRYIALRISGYTAERAKEVEESDWYNVMKTRVRTGTAGWEIFVHPYAFGRFKTGTPVSFEASDWFTWQAFSTIHDRQKMLSVGLGTLAVLGAVASIAAWGSCS